MKDVLRAFSAVALLLLFRSVTVGAEPAKYPLRVFIVQDKSQRTTTTTTQGTGGRGDSIPVQLRVTDGEGHGNLQEGDVVRASTTLIRAWTTSRHPLAIRSIR